MGEAFFFYYFGMEQSLLIKLLLLYGHLKHLWPRVFEWQVRWQRTTLPILCPTTQPPNHPTTQTCPNNHPPFLIVCLQEHGGNSKNNKVIVILIATCQMEFSQFNF